MKPAAREDPVTITMTAEEWDAVRGVGYAEKGRYSIHSRIEEATGPHDQRRAAALLEAEASLPPLTRAVRHRLGRLVWELIGLREEGGPLGDHLGRGDGWPRGRDGWNVTCIRATDVAAGGWPNMHFSRTAVWFEHQELPMSDAEKAALRDLVDGYREVVDVWGGRSWLSITWKPRKR